ncbi:MAG: 16S rRNA (cytosine(967)-C(5))-methyltransferase RsmB [Clostridia bacterium]|nr:16S rRNA (cytosine(967)-C(5))-methyltransferase RsmB [Clostridia bacterium]
MINTRKVAFEALTKIEKDSAFSNITLDAFLNKYQLDSRDKSFVSALFYGVIERKITLDYNLSLYLQKPISKLKPEAIIIFRIGAYQLLYMDKIPSSAAVNESVKLAKKYCAYASGLINAVLRKVDKNGLCLPDTDDAAYNLSVKYSCNKWLCEKWIKEYGYENTVGILSAASGSPDIFIRVNTTKINEDNLIKALAEEGVCGEKTYIENALRITLNGNDIEKLTTYKKGYFHVQDLASQICVKALDAKEGETVFDLCSAPGGKAYTAAEYMKNKGKILCFDKYESRVKLINDGAARLGLNIISGSVSDALVYREELGTADRVLCDVPCSGTGIIRRKPEIKYKSYEEVDTLPNIQYAILKNGSKYVKEGGRLIYSTCALSKKENENVCEKFLKENADFIKVSALPEISEKAFITLMPHINSSDGFFIACFERKSD